MSKEESNLSVSTLEKGLLDIDHPLYDYLQIEKPLWWEIIKADTDLYVEIRKHNKIIVYYRGGRVAEIKQTTDGLSITAHPKYLGITPETNPSAYRIRNNRNEAIYQPCSEWLENRLEELKENVRLNYTGDEDGDNTSEKLIQSEIILGNVFHDKDGQYIDSEFSHRLYVGKRLQVRIDLVKIKDNKIVFEELKRNVDSRLWTDAQGRQPEIVTQILNYRTFLGDNAKALAEYYKTLFKIKEKLGLPVPRVDDVAGLTVDVEPRLIIKQYTESSIQRTRRNERITAALSEIGITPLYF